MSPAEIVAAVALVCAWPLMLATGWPAELLHRWHDRKAQR